MNKFFKVLHRSKHSKARIGEIHTAHGVIKTPAFVPCATKGTLKAILPSLIKEIGTQVAFVNTYHLVSHPGADFIAKAGGIHQWAKLEIPLISDSGGFQVFSLAKDQRKNNRELSLRASAKQSRQKGDRHVVPLSGTPRDDTTKTNRKAQIRGEGFSGKIATPMDEKQPLLIKLSDDGVIFRSTYDGKIIEFTPEKSIAYQMKIGADMMMAFDECTSYPVEYKYAVKAMERTHKWLKRCIERFNKPIIGGACLAPAPASLTNVHVRLVGAPRRSPPANILNRKKQAFSLSNNNQYIYGIIHGSTFEDLRKKSAEFVVSQDTDGVAIGGVAVGEGKKLIRDQVKWVSNYLPFDRPVHLLGVGQFDDILDLVGYGIDSFDCVEPTRLARMGKLYQSQQILSRVSFPPGFAPKKVVAPRCRAPFTRATCCDEEDFEIDIFKSKYKYDLSPVDENCECYVCKNFTKSYLHHLFKQREILGYSLATYHNLWVMEGFFDKIRELINRNLI